MDTMDVWFDSGVSWHAALAERLPPGAAQPVQADVYFEVCVRGCVHTCT